MPPPPSAAPCTGSGDGPNMLKVTHAVGIDIYLLG